MRKHVEENTTQHQSVPIIDTEMPETIEQNGGQSVPQPDEGRFAALLLTSVGGEFMIRLIFISFLVISFC
jgi:hypothetical protein